MPLSTVTICWDRCRCRAVWKHHKAEAVPKIALAKYYLSVHMMKLRHQYPTVVNQSQSLSHLYEQLFRLMIYPQSSLSQLRAGSHLTTATQIFDVVVMSSAIGCIVTNVSVRTWRQKKIHRCRQVWTDSNTKPGSRILQCYSQSRRPPFCQWLEWPQRPFQPPAPLTA